MRGRDVGRAHPAMTVAAAAAGALLLLGAAAPHTSAQTPRCTSDETAPPNVFYASVGSATGAHRRLNGALSAAGFAPLGDGARAGGVGLWLSRGRDCALLQLEANVLQWGARAAADGRRADFWAADLMVYGGAPVITSGRTSMYPLFGLGVRMHFLDIAGAGAGDGGPSSFSSVLRRDGDWQGPAQLVGDLGVGAHFLAGSRAKRQGLVIGARMGYVLGAAHNRWVSGADTIHGPMVNTSGPYGRLLVGMSFGRRRDPRPLPTSRPEPRVRDGRPTRRIG